MSITLRLVRFCGAADGTFGRLTHIQSGWSCYTVERPWLDNKPFVSCIPEGTYDLKLTTFNRSKVPYRTLEIVNVPGRTFIKIHRGCIPSHVEGCVALGRRRGYLDGEWAVVDSRGAFNLFRDTVLQEAKPSAVRGVVGTIQVIGPKVVES